ncbi:MAG: 4-hydroxy-tetrahydrodipicolinate synthase [Spirochaetota bacterium]
MKDATRLNGLGIALATPFLPPGPGSPGAGGIDFPAWRKLVRHVVKGGVDFLVVLGSTGEAATVLGDERDELIRTAKEECGGIPVIVGTGHNSTVAAAELAAGAARLGADGLLVVTPYYNKPQPAGLEAHYRFVAAAAPELPIILYNVPGRTGLNLLPKDLPRLWAIPQVVGLKESSGNLAQIGEIARTLPKGKVLLSGDDALALPAIAVGATGLISVAGNLLPAETKALIVAAVAGRRAEAIAIHQRLLPIMDALFLESNPVPLKAALAIAGICGADPRLPLFPASEATWARLAELIDQLNGKGSK